MASESKPAAAADAAPRRRSSLREQQKRFTRERLLDSAIAVFAEKGYEAATIDDIATRAEANRGTVYLHFKNKREVVEALFDRMRESAEPAFAKLDEAMASGSRDAIRDWIRESFGWYDEHRGVVVALEQAVVGGGFESAGLASVYLEAMPHLRKRWGHARADEVRLRIWLLVNLMTRLFVVWRVDGLLPEVEEDSLVDVVTDFWDAGLRPSGKRR
jgi:AcrR family transcriptional regulator